MSFKCILPYEIWAPPVWISILIVGFNFPNTNTENIKRRESYWEWFETIGDMLPCHIYQRYYKRYLRRFLKKNNKETYIANRTEFSHVCFDIVRKIDRQQGHARCLGNILDSYEECRFLIEGMRAKCVDDQNNDTKDINATRSQSPKSEKGCIASEHGARGRSTLACLPVTLGLNSFEIDVPCQPHQIVTQDRYNTGDGFQTNEWGPIFWKMIHLFAYCYASDENEEPGNFKLGLTRQDTNGVHAYKFKRWLRSLGSVLPCVYCRTNYEKRLQEAGFYVEQEHIFSSRLGVANFCIRLHNAVNQSISPARPVINTNVVHAEYETLFLACANKVYQTCIRITPTTETTY